MADTIPGLISPGRSLAAAVGKSFVIGTVPASMAWFFLRDASWYWGLSAAFTGLGLGSGGIYKSLEKHEVRIGYAGVGTFLGAITGKLYAPGEHPLIPGIEGMLDVNMLERTSNPPAFTELAKDKIDVFIDGFFLTKVVDPIAYLTVAEKPDENLILRFESEIRLFVSQWNRGADLVLLKDLLSDFLELPSNKAEHQSEYEKLEAKLIELTTCDPPMLTSDAVENIMEDAGKFRGYAERWGLEVLEIHLEKVDIPKELTDAARKRAAAADAMAEYKIRQAARTEMAKELVDALKINGRDALNAVDQLLGLAVNRSINEIEIRDLDNVAKSFGPAMAQALAAIAKGFGTKGS